MRFAEQTGAVHMIPTTLKSAGIMGRLQYKTAASFAHTRGKLHYSPIKWT